MTDNIRNDYYSALLARDAKFDGKFFFGVKTTGVYCRPICSAKPKRENVEFFSSALQAEKSGYRPCLRCRPESAPDSPLWHGTSSVVRRAVCVLLNDESTIALNEDEFAERFGLGARHLRRLFRDELGKTPAQIMRDNRLNLARKLIVETELSFTDIAFSSGFDSVRRFNDAIRQRFSKPPTQLRRRKNASGEKGIIECSLSYRPPLDWQGCLEYYSKHRVGELEQFDDNAYVRLFQFENTIGRVRVCNNAIKNCLDVSLHIDNVNAISAVLGRVKELFDLSLDPVYVACAFDKAPALKKICKDRHGVRLARCWDRFELAVTTILGQLVSVKRAGQLTGELMALYGDKHENPFSGETVSFFPSPEKLAGETLTSLKVPRTKKTAIINLAQSVVNGNIHFSSFQDPQIFKDKLMAIHGIGPWTAEYVALRAIGDTDAFPQGDAYLDKIVDSKNLAVLSPWRGYLATTLYKYGAEK